MFKRYMIVLLVLSLILITMTIINYRAVGKNQVLVEETFSDCDEMFALVEEDSSKHNGMANIEGARILGMACDPRNPESPLSILTALQKKIESRFYTTRDLTGAYLFFILMNYVGRWIWKGQKKS